MIRLFSKYINKGQLTELCDTAT